MNNKAASMPGYGLLVGLISVVAIAALQSTGKNTDNLFESTGNIMGNVVSSGSAESGNSQPETSNIFVIDSAQTSYTGTSEDDIFVVIGKNIIAEGGKTYVQNDLTNGNGGFDISSEVVLADVNEKSAENLSPNTVINGAGGNDTVVVYGEAENFATITLNAISNGVFLNSGVSIDTATGFPAAIKGNSTDSKITFIGNGDLQITDQNIENIPLIDVTAGAKITLPSARVPQVQQINGAGQVLLTPGDDSSHITIGADVAVAEIDPHADNVTLLVSFDGNQLDKAGHSTRTQGAEINTTDQLFGAGAGIINRNAHLSFLPTGDHNLGNEDFTIEAWINMQPGTTNDNGGGMILSQYAQNLSGAGWTIAVNNGAPYMWISGNGNTSGIGSNINRCSNGATKVDKGDWVHLTFERTGDQLNCYIDGQLVESAALATGLTAFASNNNLTIGSTDRQRVVNHRFNQNVLLDEVRITKGVSRYNGGFTPPALQFADPQ